MIPQYVKKFVAFDYETTALDLYDDVSHFSFDLLKAGEIFSYSLTAEDGTTTIHRLDGKDGKNIKTAWAKLRRFWKDHTIGKVIHNYKYELMCNRVEGIEMHPLTYVDDTMIMSQMVNNLEPLRSLEYLADAYCTDPELRKLWETTDKKVRTQAKIRGNYQKVAVPLMHQYQTNDGIRTMLLWHLYKDRLFVETTNDPELFSSYRNEIKTIVVTQHMESFGIRCCEDAITELQEELREKISDTTDETYRLFKRFYNLNADDDIREILYTHLGLPVERFTKKSGLPATDKDVLLDLRKQEELIPYIDLILKYRSYTKGISMVEGYRQFINSKGVIHPNIKTNHAKTGRQASAQPNMQNVSKATALKNLFAVPARKVFKAREGDWIYLTDYSGIEMRLIIDKANCKPLMDVLIAGGDIHAVASEYWWGKLFTDKEHCLTNYLHTNKNLNEGFLQARKDGYVIENKERIKLTPAELDDYFYKKCRGVLRGGGKNCQFGLAYGAGLDQLCATLNVERSFLEPGYHAYCKFAPEVASFTKDQMKEAKALGYVTTAFGRKLLVDKTTVYAAANFVTQGTASEILKRAEVNVHNFLQENYPDVRLMLPIHDELLAHMPNKYVQSGEANTILTGISNNMENMPQIKVPLEVDWKRTNTNWNEAVGYKLQRTN